MKNGLEHRPGMVGASGFAASRVWPDERERLTAAWVALATVLTTARLWILWLAGNAPGRERLLWPWLPLAVYQDICLVVALGCLAATFLRISQHRAWRRLVRATAWLAGLAAALYAALSAQIFGFLHTPLTYRLIAMSDLLRGIRFSLDSVATRERLVALFAAPMGMCLVATLLIVRAPAMVRWLHCRAGDSRVRWSFGLYLVTAMVATRTAEIDPTVLANPHWALLASLKELREEDPFIKYPVEHPNNEAHQIDFEPPAQRAPTQPSEWHGKAKGCNVLVVVLESVGSRYLGHYGAPFDNTPNLSRLAAGGVTFDRIYASQPCTSNAMAGIFCSLYPWHGWGSLPGRAPGLGVAGLGNVLEKHNYRTALFHTGDMGFDREDEFLRRHGFGIVHDGRDLGALMQVDGTGTKPPVRWFGRKELLPDSSLLSAALNWIDTDPTRRFCLALWTIQTHHPYLVEPSQNREFSPDGEFNRYLNAIAASDELIGALYRALQARGLADSTLLVVVGDHGEAFGQHGFQGHGQILYEEVVRIPLVMILPTLAAGVRSDVLGQQIDIAPTMIELLGLAGPPEWQGQSLFAANRVARSYLYTGFHHYLFGLVEGHHKYLYNATTDRHELYDLSYDPSEQHNLLLNSAGRPDVEEPKHRLAAWLQFQNKYLSRFVPPRPTRAAN